MSTPLETPAETTTAPVSDTPLVQFDGVSRRFGSFRLALADVSFSIARGQFVLLTGPSGAGKSTILQLIAALDLPTSGSVRVAGQDIGRLRPRAVPLLRQSMGIVLQDPMLLEDRSVFDNVMLPALATGVARAEAAERAERALSRTGLPADEARRVRPRALSGGEQQRAALARAIVNRPALLLTDEPVAHLDEPAAAALLAILAQFCAAGVTVIVATHAPPAGAWTAPPMLRRLHVEAGRLQADAS
ncbi:MAG: cell division ATP-binding protein FtsE [Betaproteobacteria bacterium]